MRSSVLLPLLCLVACATEPAGRPLSAVTSAQRVLAIDFSTKAGAARRVGLARVAAVLPDELARVQHLAPAPAAVAKEADRVDALATTTTGLVTAEGKRRPRLPFPPLATPRAFGRDLVAGLAALPALGRLERAPLGEIDDRMHRTDPHDDHPEKSLWQRVQRRLWLFW